MRWVERCNHDHYYYWAGWVCCYCWWNDRIGPISSSSVIADSWAIWSFSSISTDDRSLTKMGSSESSTSSSSSISHLTSHHHWHPSLPGLPLLSLLQCLLAIFSCLLHFRTIEILSTCWIITYVVTLYEALCHRKVYYTHRFRSTPSEAGSALIVFIQLGCCLRLINLYGCIWQRKCQLTLKLIYCDVHAWRLSHTIG